MTPATAPLADHRVVVTRAEHQAGELAAALAAAGARVAHLPLLELTPPLDPAPLAAAVRDLGAWSWLVFTSANAVEAVLALAPTLPAAAHVVAVGEATADALAARGVREVLRPALPQAEGVLAELLAGCGPGDRILLPQAADARPTLAAGLRAAGLAVEVVVAYDKRVPERAGRRFAELFGERELGWVTFTSPSIARAFAALAGAAWQRRRSELRAASIGPVTSAALRRLGVEPAAEAAEPSAAAMVVAITAAVTRRAT